jgi:hypothetical protein
MASRMGMKSGLIVGEAVLTFVPNSF